MADYGGFRQASVKYILKVNIGATKNKAREIRGCLVRKQVVADSKQAIISRIR